jgi:[acyl-carrier-protein] S-malonyltransferase
MGHGIDSILKVDDRLAFVFPGQGSQSVGMLGDMAKECAMIQQVFNKASDVLDYDLWELTQQGPEEQLNRTEFTQPALLVAGVALWYWWQDQKGPTPSVFAGHSLGEYTALVCAQALSLEDAVLLVAERGRFMQLAVPEGSGAMAAILGLQNEIIENVCQEVMQSLKGLVVSPANYNTIGQVVIAGHKEAVLLVMDKLKASGAKRCQLLMVSVPSHCALMKPAALSLGKILKDVPMQLPKIPVVQNVDVAIHSTVEEIKEALIEQLCQPVRWVETIEFIHQRGVESLRECGPGTVLSALNKRIIPTLQYESVCKGVALCP